MINLGKVSNYYVACGFTDPRRGIDGLASIVDLQYGTVLFTSPILWYNNYRKGGIFYGRENSIHYVD